MKTSISISLLIATMMLVGCVKKTIVQHKADKGLRDCQEENINLKRQLNILYDRTEGVRR